MVYPDKIELQILATGHLAPYNDPDIRENVRLARRFPHGEIADSAPEMTALPKGATVIDCGAFIGDNTLEFLRKGWKVIAFEPFFDSYICAKLNAPGAEIFNAPVGNGELVELVYECNGNNHGMRSVRIVKEPSSKCASSFRLDDMKLEACDLIKIDVEGFEPHVLEGARETLKKFRPLLFVEAYEEALNRQGWTIARLEELIKSLGYSTKMVGSPPRWDWFCKAE